MTPSKSNAPKEDGDVPPLYVSHLPFEAVLAAHPYLAQALKPYAPIYTVSLFAGLLTVPELQSNGCRLEALVHLALAEGAGTKRPSNSAVAAWFKELGSGPCGVVEDPAEDAFTSVITSQQGNFRIFEGIWESAAFFLQRIVNIVETMPDDEPWLGLRASVFALLMLSDLICERAGLTRYEFGNPLPEAKLPRKVERMIPALRGRVAFTTAELKDHGVTLEVLDPFIFRSDLRRLIPQASLTHSPLVHQPLIVQDGQLVVALPTALSVAIRGLVAGGLASQGLKQEFLDALADEYEFYFRENPPIGVGPGAPISFQSTDNGVMASIAKEVDVGRYLQLIFVLDTLEGFDETAFAGANPDPHALAGDFDQWTDNCLDMAKQQANYRGGMTVIVGCGIGRAAYHESSGKHREGWRTIYLSAPDIASLSDLGETDAKTLWRILDGEERLCGQGVDLLNVNGMLNLVAWVRWLGGHLIDHSQVPIEFGAGGKCQLMVDPSAVRQLRQEVAQKLDRHAALTADGRWVVVRKTGDALFAENRAIPLFVSIECEDDENLPMVYESTARSWWCRVGKPFDFARWKLMSTWLPRIASVLDAEVNSLPELVTVEVAFEDNDENPLTDEQILTRDEIENDISVTVDAATPTIAIAVGHLFEHGLAQPTNVSEAALVAAIVKGCLELAGHPEGIERHALTQTIVPDERARDRHLFQARHFRDFVAGKLERDPIGIDVVDSASLRLGLSWRVRSQEDGREIDGQQECNAFLNALVADLENDLCIALRKFDRKALIHLALQNHESAMIRQATWRRTTSAMLALHHDREKTLATIAEQGFENHGVLHASRVLVELAVCECPLSGGHIPGEMDLSFLMAQLMLLSTLGDWSDAIYYGGMRPIVLITPLGDVHLDPSFLDNVVTPFGHLMSGSIVDASVADYSKNFEAAHVVHAAAPAFEDAFVKAWRQEKHAGLDSYRQFVDELEDYGIRQQEPVVVLKRSELLELSKGHDVAAKAIVAELTTTPRSSWRVVPPGMLDKDRRPWRFRRRLSLLRRPIVQIGDEPDPVLIVAPGLVRDAVAYTVRNYHEGYFPLWQVETAGMKAWAGSAAERRGSAFSREVAGRLEELGWEVNPEIKVTKILGKRLNRDYGDVDVLAWDAATRRILLVECKDLHFHKTAGELAEQLSDFRGEVRSGKRDLLRKHLDRCAILRDHADVLSKFIGVTGSPVLEGWIVFRNPVPMLIDWEKHADAIRVTYLTQLHEV